MTLQVYIGKRVCWVCGYPDVRVYGCVGYAGVWVYGYMGVLGMRVCGYTGIRVCWVCGCVGIRVHGCVGYAGVWVYGYTGVLGMRVCGPCTWTVPTTRGPATSASFWTTCSADTIATGSVIAPKMTACHRVYSPCST
jgi:hypothetical protein